LKISSIIPLKPFLFVLQNDVKVLKDSTTALQSKVVELQKSPYASGTQSKNKLEKM